MDRMWTALQHGINTDRQTLGRYYSEQDRDPFYEPVFSDPTDPVWNAAFASVASIFCKPPMAFADTDKAANYVCVFPLCGLTGAGGCVLVPCIRLIQD